MNSLKKYKLVSDDGKTMYSGAIKWISWNNEGTMKRMYDRPAIKRSLIMYEPGKITEYYNWLTKTIVDIKIRRKDFI